MDYGKLISRAFQITLRHRFLWLLGILAGGGGGSFQYSYGGGDEFGAPTDLPSVDPVAAWISAHLPLVILLGAILFLIVIFLVVLAIIAKGGLIATFANRPRLWDIAAGALIAECAGAVVSDWQGGKIFPVDVDNYQGAEFRIMAANKKVHDQILELIK